MPTRRGPCEPSDFVVRAEAFGVPQRRHRLFIIGLRADVATHGPARRALEIPETRRTLVDVIGDMPALRSGLSRGGDDTDSWELVVRNAAQTILPVCIGANGQERFHG